MKTCKECQIEKPLTEFYKDAKTPGGYRHNCKECKNKKTAEWRNNNREHYNAMARAHHRKHYQKFRLQRYDLTPEQHTTMVEEQEQRCYLCNKLPETKRPLVVDHDHDAGVTRKLLCYTCNRDMSIVDKDEQLKKCIAYRDAHRVNSKQR